MDAGGGHFQPKHLFPGPSSFTEFQARGYIATRKLIVREKGESKKKGSKIWEQFISVSFPPPLSKNKIMKLSGLI